MRVMSQLLVHIRPGCGHRLWCALCLKVHLLSILPLYNQSRTLQGYWDPVLTSRGVCPAQHTLVRSPRDHGRVSLLRRTEQDSVTGYGAAARHGLVLSLRRFKQTQPSHPHTLRQKSTGSSRAWRSPFLSFVSFLRVWRLTCLNASQSAPQIHRPAHHTSGTPARPVPANKSAGSPSVPRRLKSPAPPGSSPLPPMHVPGCRVLSSCNPLARPGCFCPTTTTTTQNHIRVFLDQRVREEERKPCKLCEHQLGTTYRSMSVG